MLVITLCMGDESGVDVVFQDDSIHALAAEHVDVLALLNFVGDVVNSRFFRLFLLVSVFRIFGILRSFSLLLGVLCRSFFFLILVDAVLKSQIFSVDVLEQNIVHHLLGEFLVLDASVFDEWVDIIPVFLVILTVGFAHAGELVSEFCSALRDTFSGRSGQSMTPFKSIRYSGMTSLMLSAINTWLLYSLMVPSMESYSVLIRGK